jgi:hypothetical protein
MAPDAEGIAGMDKDFDELVPPPQGPFNPRTEMVPPVNVGANESVTCAVLWPLVIVTPAGVCHKYSLAFTIAGTVYVALPPGQTTSLPLIAEAAPTFFNTATLLGDDSGPAPHTLTP